MTSFRDSALLVFRCAKLVHREIRNILRAYGSSGRARTPCAPPDEHAIAQRTARPTERMI